MHIKGLEHEDFVNYKKASMFIICPSCTFKCEKENGVCCCQNSDLASHPIIEVSDKYLIESYLNNPITSAIVFGGLEPFDHFDELEHFIYELRVGYSCLDDVVIYTGYNKDEIATQIQTLKCFPNIIVKFGRYLIDSESRYDEILGVTLASVNQYAEKLDFKKRC